MTAYRDEDVQRIRELIYTARTLLIEAIEAHEALCQSEQCREKANVLAFLAHSIGAHADDVKAFPAMLFDYDMKCAQGGGCPAHPAASALPAFRSPRKGVDRGEDA